MLKLADIAGKSLFLTERYQPIKIATSFTASDNSWLFNNKRLLTNFSGTNLYHMLQPTIKSQLATHKGLKIIVQFYAKLSKLNISLESPQQAKDGFIDQMPTSEQREEFAYPYVTSKSNRIFTGMDLMSLSENIFQEI